jgi:hypothetical protein
MSIQAEDEMMIAILVNDALDGIDVAARYPDHYRRLLAVPELHAAFLEILELLEKDRAGELAPLPAEPSHDLSFLPASTTPTPAFEKTPGGQWRATWRQTARQVQALFAGLFQPPDLAYRDAGLWPDENDLTLIRSQIEVAQGTLDVTLEAGVLAEQPDALGLSLLATTATPTAASAIEAHLTWGTYAQTVAVPLNQRVSFPPIDLKAITDPTTAEFTADLHLRLENV